MSTRRLRAIVLLALPVASVGCDAGAGRREAGVCYQLAWTGPPGSRRGELLPPHVMLTGGSDSGRAVPSSREGDSTGVWIGFSSWRRLGGDSLEIRLRSIGEIGALVELHEAGDSVRGSAMYANEFIDSLPPDRFLARGARVPCTARARRAG